MAIHEYEWLAAEAATTGDRHLALQALMAHPFVKRKAAAEAILEEGLQGPRRPPPAVRSGWLRGCGRPLWSSGLRD